MAGDQPETGEPSRRKVDEILRRAITSGRSLLTEIESKEVLGLYGIPTVQTNLARSAEDAVGFAQAIGFSVVLKVQGRAAVDITLLEQVLVRFSRMVVEQRRIKEVDINPLLASPEGVLALDARIVLYG